MKKKLSVMAILFCLTAMIVGSTAFATDYPELSVTINGRSMTIDSNYDASEIPAGFHEAELDYQGTTFYGGVDDNTGSIELFHVRCDEDSVLSGWYFRASDDSLYKYDGLDISSKHLMVLAPGADVEIPSGYSETEIPVNNAMVTAWAPTEDASASLIGTYLLYGSFDGANIGWYVYDQREETVQRFIQTTDAQVIEQQDEKITRLQEQLTELNDKYNNDVSKSKNMYLRAMLLAVLCFILMINALLKRRHIRLDLEDRIEDLKRHGGVETRQYSKMEAKYNARRDAKAAKRAIKYEDSVGADVFDYDPTQSDGSSLRDLADTRAKKRNTSLGDEDDYNYELMDSKKGRRQSTADKKAAKKAEKVSRKRGRDAAIEAEIAAAEAAVAAGTLTGMHTVDETGDYGSKPQPRRTRRPAADMEDAPQEAPRRARRPRPESVEAEADMGGRAMGDRPRRGDRDPERAEAERAAARPPRPSRKARQIAANGTTVMDDDGNQIQVKNRPVKKARISRDTLADTERALSDDAFDYEQLEKSLADMTEQVMNLPDNRPKATLSSSANMAEVGDRDHSFDVDFVDL